ncbi:MAG: c-type cytochrome [Saprospiraceae bacterium]|nr:c-type cytochrome [Saprospiraceae bacterium]
MMRLVIISICIFTSICILSSWQNSAVLSAKNTESIMVSDTFDMQKALATLREQIKGNENLPADSVFQNIKLLKKMPAGRLLGIMEIAFSNSLGVTCEHCHTPNAWEKEDKPTKQIARDMWVMMGKINNDLLKNIPNLQSKQPTANCTTCHRGQVKPAISLK